jgi:hypothetical protein
MRTQVIPILLIAIICAAPQATYSQGKVPGENTVAIGGNVGFHAVDIGVAGDNGANLEAFVEYYYTPRASLRAMCGWAEPELEPALGCTLRQQRVLVNVLYNWELGWFRPFATIGGGAYFLPRQDGASVGGGTTKPGANIGWGVEYYLRTFAVRSEMNVHILNRDSPEWAGELSGFSWTFGVKVPF